MAPASFRAVLCRGSLPLERMRARVDNLTVLARLHAPREGIEWPSMDTRMGRLALPLRMRPRYARLMTTVKTRTRIGGCDDDDPRLRSGRGEAGAVPVPWPLEWSRRPPSRPSCVQDPAERC